MPAFFMCCSWLVDTDISEEHTASNLSVELSKIYEWVHYMQMGRGEQEVYR
jgi:hypothetical protein